MCVQVCEHVYIHAYMCVCGGPRGQPQGTDSETFSTSFDTASHWPRAHPFSPRDLPASASPAHGLQATASIFMNVLGLELRPSYLQVKHFTG